jgi:hypothetical protein
MKNKYLITSIEKNVWTKHIYYSYYIFVMDVNSMVGGQGWM